MRLYWLRSNWRHSNRTFQDNRPWNSSLSSSQTLPLGSLHMIYWGVWVILSSFEMIWGIKRLIFIYPNYVNIYLWIICPHSAPVIISKLESKRKKGFSNQMFFFYIFYFICRFGKFGMIAISRNYQLYYFRAIRESFDYLA